MDAAVLSVKYSSEHRFVDVCMTNWLLLELPEFSNCSTYCASRFVSNCSTFFAQVFRGAMAKNEKGLSMCAERGQPPWLPPEGRSQRMFLRATHASVTGR